MRYARIAVTVPETGVVIKIADAISPDAVIKSAGIAANARHAARAGVVMIRENLHALVRNVPDAINAVTVIKTALASHVRVGVELLVTENAVVSRGRHVLAGTVIAAHAIVYQTVQKPSGYHITGTGLHQAG